MEKSISANKRNSFLFIILMVVLTAIFGVAVYYYFGQVFGLVVGGVMAVYFFIGYSQSARIAIYLNDAKEVSKKDQPRLIRMVENLSITLGLPQPKVYVIDDPAINAFTAGLKPEKAIIGVTTGLLELEDNEVEGVLAHEFGHIANYDCRLNTMIIVFIAAFAIVSQIVWHMLGSGRDRNSNSFLFILAILAMSIVFRILFELARLAISRQREYLADAHGAQTTKYPQGLMSALQKISQQGSSLKKPNRDTAHLFFANPLAGLSKFFATHPPVEDRIARLSELESKGY